MEEHDKHIKISREELVGLHSHYEIVAKDELDFFFKYLNFYIGLLSVLLIGNLTVIATREDGLSTIYNYCFLLCPLLIIIISYIGYKNIKVYFRRFLEAVITSMNLKAMLGYSKEINVDDNVGKPDFPNENRSFITQLNRKKVKLTLDKAKEKNWNAEKLLSELLKNADTLIHAKITLFGFAISGICIFIIIAIDLFAGR